MTEDYPFKTVQEINDLIFKAQNSDKNAMSYLILNYEPMVFSKAKNFTLSGGDFEDLLQEGRLGIYSAVLSFNPELSSNFTSFVSVCINRRLINVVKAAARKKHLPLNSFISIDKQNEEDSKLISDFNYEPEQIVLNRERLSLFREIVSHELSDLERKVFFQYIDGKTYKEIANDLNVPQKAVDNAITRIKRKLSNILV